jgi:nitroreductase
MDVEKAIRTRRTHKAFAAQALEETVLDELFELARWAPNHHLTNPWRFRVLGERARERLMELAESEQPGSAVKLQRAPTLVAVTARAERRCGAGPRGPARDRRRRLPGAARRARARFRRLLAHGRAARRPRGREILGLEATETPVGLLYLGHRPCRSSACPSARREFVIRLE